MTPKIKKAGTVPADGPATCAFSRAQRQSYHGLQPHEELAAPQLIGLVVRAGLDFEPRPSYSIATAEMTRECPHPIPRADRGSGVANCQEDAPRTALKPQSYERGAGCLGVSAASDRWLCPGLAPLRRQHGGQQSIVPSDFALIPKVLNESDDAIRGNGTRRATRSPS